MLLRDLRTHLTTQPIVLPGEEAQLRMAPVARAQFPMDERTIAAATRSAVLILIYPKNDAAHTVLIKRNEYPGVHSAQVSFPGGRHEDADDDFYMTALREAEEEVGIRGESLDLISPLTQLYIPPSRFLVFPFVAMAHAQPEFIPDPKEVQFLIELDLARLLDDSIVHSREMRIANGLVTPVPYYDIDGHTVWGATAMIMSELKELLKTIG